MRARELTIRAGRKADAPFLQQLGQVAFGEYARAAGRHTVSMARSARTLIAERDAAPVGLALVDFPEATLAHLTAIAVTTNERGTGVGQALLEAALALSRQHGARRLRVMTADSNVAALALFLRAGFQRAAIRSQRYGRGQRAVFLEIAL